MRSRGRSSPRAAVVAVGAALALLATACGSSGGPPAARPYELARAEAWFAHLHDAEAAGFANLQAYYTRDVAVDFRALDGMAGSWDGLPAGRVSALQHAVDLWGLQGNRRSTEPVYLSREGAVDPVQYTGPNVSTDAAFVYTITAGGASSELFAGSALWASRRLQPNPAALPSARSLAERYVRAWSTADAARAKALYARGAVLQDSLLGVRAAGMAEIGSLTTSGPAEGGLAGAALKEIPDAGGRAYYLSGDFARRPRTAQVDRIVLLLDVDPTHACPGAVAVVLRIDGGVITAEQRYHRVDAVRRCDAPPPPGGWWNEVSAPDKPVMTRTGAVRGPDHEIALFDATRGLHDLVAWAVSRYTVAGLRQPGAESVTFLPHDADECQTMVGLARGTDLILCFGRSDVCEDESCTAWRPWAKEALLHELGHTWIRSFLTPEARAAFVAATGLAWTGPDLAWGEHGSELAAETLAWGLMDEPFGPDRRFGSPSCAQLGGWFELLTGRAPLQRTCSADGSQSPGE